MITVGPDDASGLAAECGRFTLLNCSSAGDLCILDVRLTIRTHDGALVQMQYGGRLDLSSPATGVVSRAAPLFETGDERYRWLNRIQAVAKGFVKPGPNGTVLEYEIFEVL